MNKRKLIAALLASACITAGAFGIAGCEGCNNDTSDTDTRDTQIVAVYNLYADNARANGETVLSYDEWLKSIKGENGTNGKSAYELAVDKGFVGTEAEWLEGLKGSNGKSAYEIAKEHGFKGTEAEWLETLKGESGSGSGSSGKSAYEIAKEHGFVGTEAEWLESLKGGKGEQGAGIVSVKQITDKWGICSYFEFTLSNGNTIDTSATPMINIDVNKNYVVENEEEKKLLISYGVNEDNIYVLVLKGIKADNQTISIGSNHMNELRVQLNADGKWQEVPLFVLREMGAKIDDSGLDIYREGEYTVSGELMGFKFSFKVTVKADEREIVGMVNVFNPNSRVRLQELKENPDLLYYIEYEFIVFYSDGMQDGIKLTAKELNINYGEITAVGAYESYGEYNGYKVSVKLIVYDENGGNELIDISVGYNDLQAGVTAEEVLDRLNCIVVHANGEYNAITLRKLGASLDKVDLSSAGEKTVQVNYEGKIFNLSFYLSENRGDVAPEIKSFTLSENNPKLYAGMSQEDILNKLAYKIVYTNGDEESGLLVYLDVDFSGEDLSVAGEKCITVRFGSNEFQAIIVLHENELLCILTGTDTSSQLALAGTPITEIGLYGNGIAQLNLSGADKPVDLEYFEESGLLILQSSSMDTAIIFQTDGKTFSTATPEALQQVMNVEKGVTYTGTVSDKTVEIVVYGIRNEEGNFYKQFAFYTVDGNTYGLLCQDIDADRNVFLVLGVGAFKVNDDGITVSPTEMPDLNPVPDATYTVYGKDTFTSFALTGRSITGIKLYDGGIARVFLNGETEPLAANYEINEKGFIEIWDEDNGTFFEVLRLNKTDEGVAEFSALTEEDMQALYDFTDYGTYTCTADGNDFTAKLFCKEKSEDGIVFYTVEGNTYVLWYNNFWNNGNIRTDIITITNVGTFSVDTENNTLTPTKLPE